MLAPIDFSRADVIVELGPGTGAITTEILRKMKKNSRLYLFEINEYFLEELKHIKDPRVEIINESAEKFVQELKKRKVSKADYVISSIPLAIMPRRTEISIIVATKKFLSDNGAFIQFQYSLTSYGKLRKLFADVELSFTPYNIPPAFIFICKTLPEKTRRSLSFAKTPLNMASSVMFFIADLLAGK